MERNIFEINKYIAYLSRVEQGESLALVKKITEKNQLYAFCKTQDIQGYISFTGILNHCKKRVC